MSDVTVVGSVGYTVVPDVPPNFAAQLTDALKPALDSAATDLTVAFKTGTDGASSALDGFSRDVNGRLRDEFGKFVTEADAAAMGMTASLSKGAKDSGDAIKDGVGAGVLSLKDIVIGSAIGDLIADSIKTGVQAGIEAMKDLISFLPDLGSEIQGQFNMIRSSTGETGQMLDGLKDSFNNIARSSPADLGDIGKAVSVLNQRLDDTGPALEATSLGVLRLSKLTGSDLSSNLKGVTGAFVGFNIKADDQAGKLDELYRIYQRTGISVSELTNALGTVGQTAQLSGVSFEETASLVGLLDKAGLSAGQAQQAFTKILKDSVAQGKDAKVGFRETFAAIANGTMSLDDGFKLFGPRAAAVFGAIRSGKLDFASLAKEITAGGDTLKGVAVETSTWTGQLGLLVNALKIDLEPIALQVFGAMTDAVRAFRPVIEQAANFVIATFTPALQGLAAAAIPVWQFFDKIRTSFAEALTTFNQTGDVFEAVATFFYDLTGDADKANGLADALRSFAGAISGVWDALQPVRDAIAEAFNTIKDAVAGFFQDHPDAALAGLAATVGAIVVPALLGLGGVLLGLVGTVASFVAGMPLAIGAVVAGIVYAYQHFETFRNIVDNSWRIIQEDVIPAFKTFAGFVMDTVVPAVIEFGKQAGSVFSAIGEFASRFIGPIVDALTSLYHIFDGIIHLNWDTIKEGLAGLGQALLDLLGTVLSSLGDLFMSALEALGPLLVSGLQAAWQVVVDNGPAVLETLWEWIQAIPGMLVSLLGSLGELLVSALTGAFDFIVQNGVTILGKLVSWSLQIPVLLVGGLVKLGQLLWDALKAAFGWIVEHGPDILEAVFNWVQGIPGMLVDGIKNLGQLLFDGMKAAFGFLVKKGPDIIQGIVEFMSHLPEKIFGAITGALGAAGGFVADVAKNIFNGIAGFINDHLIKPIREFKIEFFGKDFMPFSGLAEITKLAQGGVFDKPTLALIGEAGREAVVPLDRPERAREVMREAGLSRSAGGGGDIYVTVNPTYDASMTRDRAAEYGNVEGDAIAQRLSTIAVIRAS